MIELPKIHYEKNKYFSETKTEGKYMPKPSSLTPVTKQQSIRSNYRGYSPSRTKLEPIVDKRVNQSFDVYQESSMMKQKESTIPGIGKRIGADYFYRFGRSENSRLKTESEETPSKNVPHFLRNVRPYNTLQPKTPTRKLFEERSPTTIESNKNIAPKGEEEIADEDNLYDFSEIASEFYQNHPVNVESDLRIPHIVLEKFLERCSKETNNDFLFSKK